MSRSFGQVFRETHGYTPFPWQERLANAETLPALIDIPTGCGKTSVLDVLAWRSLVRGEARRIVWVVDRRLVVDDVFEHARLVAEKYGIHALKWRGGMTIDESWLLEPHERTLIVSTVDQVGSRLLFRGYGVPWKARSVYAGLLAFDTVIVLDEVHLSRPFEATLQRVAALAPPPDPQLGDRLPAPLKVIRMSATPGESVDTPLQLDPADHAHEVLARRVGTRKLAWLLESDAEAFRQAVLESALKQAQREDVSVVGIVVNRVRDARAVFEQLRAQHDAILLTGRIRPFDRDLLLGNPRLERARPSRDRRSSAPPLFVVATQTIEVGVDLDFDALVSEAATLTALRQRLGRLDRLGDLGESEAVIVLRRGTEKDDPIYGDELGVTWSWLWSSAEVRGKKGRVIDLGLAAHHEWPSMDAGEDDASSAGARLSERDVQVLSETHPYLDFDVDVATLLHGHRDDYQRVSLVWRRELNNASENHWPEIVGLCPPVRAEALALPRATARKWLASRDVPALRWRPGEEAEVVTAGSFSSWGEVRHEDILVVASRYRGNDPFGWNPGLTPAQAGEEVDQDVGFHPDYRGSEAFHGIERVAAEPESGEAARRFRPYPPEWGLEGGIVDHRERRRGTAQRESLSSHLAKARAEGEEILGELELGGDSNLADDVLLALELHDVGKTDRRFQVMLHDGDEIEAARAASRRDFLAKSGTDWWNFAARNRAWAASGLPNGWRHEVESVLRADVEKAADPDLTRHLMLAHHGRGRPWLPEAGQALPLVDQANRFWQVQGRCGPWALAYLEALVVIADRRASEDSQELDNAPPLPPKQPGRERRTVSSQPVLELAYMGNTFLGFMAALGTLRLLADLPVRLSWNRRRAHLHGLVRTELLEALEAALEDSEFDQGRTLREDGSRLPWDLCGAGRTQLGNVLPALREQLCDDGQRLAQTLFGPWTWQDKGDPLGWVPAMRDHALRARAPTRDQPYRENGPLWMAWEGIEVFGRRPGNHLAVGWHRSENGPWTLIWPLWTGAGTLDTVHSLLRSTPRRSGDLGVEEWWMAARIRSRGRSIDLTEPRPVAVAELVERKRRANLK